MKFIHFFTYMLTLKIGLVISGKGGRISIDGNDKTVFIFIQSTDNYRHFRPIILRIS